ncbi:mannose-1-phosphate guanylyltransferase/mannose-6-phosphate isomerase [Lacisediminimonas profundi]|uniref:mannose-1-phosphate guanylyltransferase/mannose-6-phosphate isomerase n=1 Tax=Lacisediminimonas profundi TaxID=2603856 RepID=UPI001386BA43|nr:mannose-1-phosphate guanylyltransferase/mannose-6-phosphate isomerase [Lacisediminimonas profundi]
MITPVILSGGSGTRLWPLSRAGYPKQFLPLTDDSSLFQLTLLRLAGLRGSAAPLVVCNDDHRFLIAEQAREAGVPLSAIVLEPAARNTAPAIALAALKAQQSGEDPLLLVLPSDHVFSDTPAFHAAVQAAVPAASAGQLVTFGIVPTIPETGYGYIRAGDDRGDGSFVVDRFVEKPDLATAERYLAEGGYFWNSGMFLFKGSVYLDALARHSPAMVAACDAAFRAARDDLDFCRVDKASFEACPADSVDYAVMEKTDRAVVVPLAAGWNDVGAWPAVWQVLERDAEGNAGRGDVLLENSRNCYVHSSTRLVSLLGVEDLVVVETADAIMVMHKERAQDVKKLVDRLKASGRSEATLHREVFRPWGSFDSIDEGHRFKVKRITVKPGERLSLQMHHHRAEHWVVVSGTARVRIGDAEKLVTENESVFIPIGAQHFLENPGKVSLELIEVQTGAYLGEDDIVRFEDRYGRA